MSKYTISRVISKDSIAQVCYLNEALYYIAFDVIPIKYNIDRASVENKINDIRCYGFTKDYDLKSKYELEFIESHKEINDSLNSMLISKYEIGNPFLDEAFKSEATIAAKYFKQHHSIRNKEEFLENLKGNLSNTESVWHGIESGIVNKVSAFIDIAEEYEDEIEKLTEDYKIDLHSKIKNGDIKILGLHNLNNKEEDDIKDEELKNAISDIGYFGDIVYSSDIRQMELVEIDTKALIYDKIDWINNILTLGKEKYINIIVYFSEVLKCYPFEKKKKDTTTKCYVYGSQMFIDDENISFDSLLEWRSKGGKNKHKTTDIIKRNVIKPLFLNKNLIRGTSVMQKSDNIYNELIKLHSKIKKEEFAIKYNIDISSLKEAVKYAANTAGGKIYDWCLAINKGEI